MTGIGAAPLVVLGTTEWRFRWKRNKRRNAKSRIISVCVGDEPQLKEKREYALDNTVSETFPCSDPLSSIPNPTSCLFEMRER
jgi:hypothetical protein